MMIPRVEWPVLTPPPPQTAILKRRVCLSSFLRACRDGRPSSLSMLVMLPGVRVCSHQVVKQVDLRCRSSNLYLSFLHFGSQMVDAYSSIEQTGTRYAD